MPCECFSLKLNGLFVAHSRVELIIRLRFLKEQTVNTRFRGYLHTLKTHLDPTLDEALFEVGQIKDLTLSLLVKRFPGS